MKYNGQLTYILLLTKQAGQNTPKAKGLGDICPHPELLTEVDIYQECTHSTSANTTNISIWNCPKVRPHLVSNEILRCALFTVGDCKKKEICDFFL